MNKSYYDGYIASSVPLNLNQVMRIGCHRVVVRKQFHDFQTWDHERMSRPQARKEFAPGFLTERRSGSISAEPPRDGYFYYGVDWLIDKRA